MFSHSHLRPGRDRARLVHRPALSCGSFFCLLGCVVAAVVVLPSVSGAALRITFRQLTEPALSTWAAQAFSSNESVVAPASLRELDGAEVVLTGYVMPLRYEGRGLREFLLLRNQQACCFGQPLGPLECVLVIVEGSAPTLPQDVPTTVQGRFELRPEIIQGRMCGLYSLRVSGAAGFPRTPP